MLVVEGDHRDPIGHAPQGVQIVVTPDHHIPADLSCGILRVGRQDPQAHPEGGGGCGRHPGKLSTTDHCDTGGWGDATHSQTLPTSVTPGSGELPSAHVAAGSRTGRAPVTH